MISLSNDHNVNYLAQVVQLQGVTKHPNADRLQTVEIDYQTVVTGLDARDGDWYVYFPVECAINKDFLAATNSFASKELNANPEGPGGFFDKRGRVRAVKLRDVPSCGYIVPVDVVEKWADVGIAREPASFDTINDKLLLSKYVPASPRSGGGSGQKRKSSSRLIDGQVRLHVDTKNLRKEVRRICPDEYVSITRKKHGTSAWVSHVLTKRKLPLRDRIAKWFGVAVKESEYDLVYGSRSVVKNSNYNDNPLGGDYCGEDVWGVVAKEIGHKIPQCFTVYGEILGYLPGGKMIQKDYDYGCKPGEHLFEVYRVTFTNASGDVYELAYPERIEFCSEHGLYHVEHIFYGPAVDVLPEYPGEDNFADAFVDYLSEQYLEEMAWDCGNAVPDEGIVVRVESLTECKPYKLKSFAFLQKETAALDDEKEEVLE